MRYTQFIYFYFFYLFNFLAIMDIYHLLVLVYSSSTRLAWPLLVPHFILLGVRFLGLDWGSHGVLHTFHR